MPGLMVASRDLSLSRRVIYITGFTHHSGALKATRHHTLIVSKGFNCTDALGHIIHSGSPETSHWILVSILIIQAIPSEYKNGLQNFCGNFQPPSAHNCWQGLLPFGLLVRPYTHIVEATRYRNLSILSRTAHQDYTLTSGISKL